MECLTRYSKSLLYISRGKSLAFLFSLFLFFPLPFFSPFSILLSAFSYPIARTYFSCLPSTINTKSILLLALHIAFSPSIPQSSRRITPLSKSVDALLIALNHLLKLGLTRAIPPTAALFHLLPEVSAEIVVENDQLTM